ncbi:MAG: ROK family protein [Acidimicrobiales bacterium]
MRLTVGIDAGGTKLAAAVVDPSDGRLIERREVPTYRHRGGAAVLEDCAGLARGLAAGFSVAAIGLGVPELVSLQGQIQSAENWDWRDGRWKPTLDAIAPVFVESDVRAAALAEARFGAGRTLSSFLYMTIGTGVSHCFVCGGSPWSGARGNAVVTGAPLVETVASGPALAARAGKPRAEDVLASPGDEAVVAVSVSALGLELARLVNALDPQAVVIGGGLGLAPGFREQIVETMRPAIYAEVTRGLEVLPGALGVHAGVIGAALVADDALAAQSGR